MHKSSLVLHNMIADLFGLSDVQLHVQKFQTVPNLVGPGHRRSRSVLDGDERWNFERGGRTRGTNERRYQQDDVRHPVRRTRLSPGYVLLRYGRLSLLLLGQGKNLNADDLVFHST